MIAYAELGFSTSTDQAAAQHMERTAYMYIVGQRIVGLCLMERIKDAHRLRQDGTRAKTAEEAILGIHLLWIHKRHRRQGLAKLLVNAACERMVYGYIVPVEQVAVSSPTSAGTRFAQRFCGRLDILVYDCIA